MEKREFNSIVLQHFEEIKEKYEFDKKNIWDDEEIGSTILIEDDLMPFIYDHIENERIMNRLSELLEELLSLKDNFCEEVLYCSFFEKIRYEKTEEKFIRYFRENTKEFYDQLRFEAL